MTTTVELADRADTAPHADWMALAPDDLRWIGDMAKCLTVVDDMLLVYADAETCPHRRCPTALRCFNFESCLEQWLADRC